jgi:hypothetical protein
MLQVTDALSAFNTQCHFPTQTAANVESSLGKSFSSANKNSCEVPHTGSTTVKILSLDAWFSITLASGF